MNILTIIQRQSNDFFILQHAIEINDSALHNSTAEFLGGGKDIGVAHFNESFSFKIVV